MNPSDLAIAAFVCVFCSWAVSPWKDRRRYPRPRIRHEWIFKAPDGSRMGVHVPAASPKEALERFLTEVV